MNPKVGLTGGGGDVKIHKLQPRLIQKNMKRRQITIIRNEKEDITTGPKDFKDIKVYYEQLYTN